MIIQINLPTSSTVVFRWSYGIVMWEICSYGELFIYSTVAMVTNFGMFILALQDNHHFMILTSNLIGQILSVT